MQLDFQARELTVKLVYYGPALSGKTTNLQAIHRLLSPEGRGRLMTLETRDDRTLFFDLLPLSFNTASGLTVRIKLFTVPGQVIHNSTRKLVLQGADGVAFIADSQVQEIRANQASFKDLRRNLRENGLDPAKIPLVIQYNKRDLPNAAPIAELQSALNPGWPVEDPQKQRVTPDPFRPGEYIVQQQDGQWIERSPYFEAVAMTGEGVFDTLKAVSKLVVKTLG